MGAINNLPYVIVNSASNTIADSFGVKNLVGVVFGANVALSIFVKGLNTFVLLSVPFYLRYLINGCVMLLGLFGVAYAFSFGFAIACIVILGSTAAFGENVTLGMMSRFPSHMVNAWSSGTGMAGLLGASIYVVFGCTVGSGTDQNEKMHSLTKYAFLLTTPAVLVYWFAYFVVLRFNSKEDARGFQESDNVTGSVQDASPQSAQHEEPSEHVVKCTEDDDDQNVKQTLETTKQRIWRCFKLVLYLAINLGAVYAFEYVARGCAAKVRPQSEYHVGCPELYAALQLCYQAGVFVSRSSVQMFRIRRVDVLTALQLFNMLLWVLDVPFKILPVYLLPALMVFVGLLGGASYVNIFYMLLNDTSFPSQDRELCINITAMFITLGIILGTGIETLLFTTVLKDD